MADIDGKRNGRVLSRLKLLVLPGIEMREAFSQHFATDPDRREKLWENCLFVFDTNVLTGIYRRSEEARDAQYKLMVALGDRLWIPHRVIYEFLDNRAKIVHDQAQLYAVSISELQGMLSSFEVVTRHPFLSAKVYGEFNLVSQKVLKELEASREFHDSRITNDDVKIKLAEILEGKVGPAFSEERLVEIVKEGELRYAQNIPPGFEDRGKHKGSTITEEIRKRYGDLIIWYQVIEKAKAEQLPVIIVTGDQKADWWAEQSGKKLGPLPALIEEFQALSGQDFYLYSYHGFLDLANQHLDQKTSASVIEEVRESAMLDAETIDEDSQEIVEGKEYPVNALSIEQWKKLLARDYSESSALRAMRSEKERLQGKIEELQLEMTVKRNLLRDAISKKHESNVGKLRNDLFDLRSKAKIFVGQLNYVQDEIARYHSERGE